MHYMKEYINEYLNNYIKKNNYPWHMPGHKRQIDCQPTGFGSMYQLDFTEAKDLDDLHEPETFMKESLKEISEFYGTAETFMLVNGSTVGILSSMYACLDACDRVLLGRNCHKSVYNAISLIGCRPYYILPELQGDINLCISPKQVEIALCKLEKAGELPKALVITSPTYEGVISNISAISKITKRYGVILIVDGAHGAHLKFMPHSKTALEEGGDIVIESTHKTLPTMTQTGLLHVRNEELAKRVKYYLDIFQTSSPSYVMLQSIEHGVAFSANHPEIFVEYEKQLIKFREKCRELQVIQLFNPENVYDYDIGKLVFILPKGWLFKKSNGTAISVSGQVFLDILGDKYGQILEMACGNYVLAMTSLEDKRENYDALLKSLMDMEKSMVKSSYIEKQEKSYLPEMVCSPFEALKKEGEYIILEKAIGEVAADYVYSYPPGIPVVCPGEKYDKSVVLAIKNMIEKKLKVLGIKKSDQSIFVKVIKSR